MVFIECFKTRSALIIVFVCLILAALSTLSCGFTEQEQETASPEPAVTLSRETKADPNSNSAPKEAALPTAPKQSDNDITDPNESDISAEPEEENDDFSPKVSTYITINNAYEKILNSDIITDQGMVRYSLLRRKRNDLITAAKNLDQLNPAILMNLSSNERLAFWINTYNVCILKLIVDNYPIEPKRVMGLFYPDNSIMQISGDWRTKHFFDIQGLDYNLKEIEEEFLLARHKDPKILFALSYASWSGATLRNEPYVAEKLEKQLDDQVRRYLRTPRGLEINTQKDVLHLSNLFTMHHHKELFLSSDYATIKRFRDRKPEEQAWLNFIRDYLTEDEIRYLETASFDVKFMKYNWLLNEAH